MSWVELPFASATVTVTCYLTFSPKCSTKLGMQACRVLPSHVWQHDSREARVGPVRDLTQGKSSSFFSLAKTEAEACLIDWNRYNG